MIKCDKKLTVEEKEKVDAYLKKINGYCWSLYGLSQYKDSRLYMPVVSDCAHWLSVTVRCNEFSFGGSFNKKAFQFIKDREAEMEKALYDRLLSVEKDTDVYSILRSAITDLKMITLYRYRVEKICC